MRRARGCFASAQLGPFGFVFAGITSIKYREYGAPEQVVTSDCEKYNSVTGEWTQLQPMPEPVKNSSATCVSREVIYVFGGQKPKAQRGRSFYGAENPM
jgi:N-acetylneuraminic acid mutarotase